MDSQENQDTRQSRELSLQGTYRLITMLAFSVLLPVIGSIVAIVMGVDKRFKEKTIAGVIAAILIGGVYIYIYVMPIITVDSDHPEVESKSNLSTIQIALERFGEEHNGLYPNDIDTLITEHYILEFPANPFTRELMRNITFEETPFPGEFTYIPVNVEGEVAGYFLLIYGSEESVTYDFNEDGIGDHVIMILQENNKVFWTYGWDNLPPEDGLSLLSDLIAESE